jgi:hypothetical protein
VPPRENYAQQRFAPPFEASSTRKNSRLDDVTMRSANASAIHD